MSETNRSKIIEYLQCALINCDNTKSMGHTGLIDIVKLQIEEALKLVEKELEDSP